MAENVSLGNAYVTIIPSMRGFEREMNKGLSGIDFTRTGKKLGTSLGGSMATAVSDRLVHVGDSLVSAGSKLADVGGKLTAGITVPLAGATAAVGTFALRTASAAETTEISFTTMLGSEEAALSMMEELADFAAHTPFELSGLQTATRQLLAYGFTAEDVIPMLTAVGDATAALGTGQAGIEAVTRALGQMQTRGKASAEEMLQLTEAGIPAWEYLARAIGTDTAGAMEAVSDGAVDANTAIEALTSGMEQDFGGMMEEQSKTVEGLFSNLSDAIEQPLMKLRDSSAYERFAESLEDVVDSAGPFVESLLPHMERGLDTVSDVLDSATDAMDAFSEMGEEGQEQLIDMATAAAAAGPALTVAGKGMQLLGSAAKGAGSLIKAGQKAFGTLGDKLLDFATAPETAGTALGKLAGVVASIPTPVTVAAVVIGGIAVTALGAMAAEAQEAAEHEALLADATTSASDIMSSAIGSADELGDAIGGISIDSEATLQSLADLNASVAETLGETATDGGRLDQYVSAIDELANRSGLTATEQYRLNEAVDGFNEITGESYSVVDAASGKIADQNGVLQENTDQLHASADAWKSRAQSEALSNVATQYLEAETQAAYDLQVARSNLASTNSELTAAESEYAAVSEELNGITDVSSDRYYELQTRQGELAEQMSTLRGLQEEYTEDVRDLSAAHETAAQSASDFSNMAAIESAVFSALGDDAVDFASQLGETGLGLETFAGLTDDQLNAVAESWDGTTGSIFAALDELGVRIPASGWTSMLGLDMALGEGGADAINTALAVSGMTAQQFADKVGEYGITGNASILAFANAIAAGDTQDAAAQKALEGVTGFEEGSAGALDAGLGFANTLAAGIEGGSVSVEDATAVLQAAATGDWSGAVEAAREAGVSVPASFSSGVTNGSYEATGATSRMLSAVALRLTGGDVAAAAELLGHDIDSGLAQGIVSGTLSEQESALLGQDVIDAARTSLESHSPSQAMARVGSDADAGLAQGISGSAEGPLTAMSDLATQLVERISGLPGQSSLTGSSASSGLAGGLASGVSAVGSAASSLSSTAASGVSGVPSELSGTGREASSGFASGVGSGEGATRTGALRVARAAGGMADVGNPWQWGYDATSNFASGISGALGLVTGAVSRVASTVASFLHHSTPEEGPLSDDDVWGLHLGQNLADGMWESIPGVERASLAMAEAAAVDASATWSATAMRAAPPRATGGGGDTDALLRRVVALLEDIYGVIPEGMDGRSFGRAVRRAVAYGY